MITDLPALECLTVGDDCFVAVSVVVMEGA